MNVARLLRARAWPSASTTARPLSSFAAAAVARATLVAAATLVVTTAGCRFGEASFSSTVADLTFEPDGTVFGYLDAHDVITGVDDDPRVALGMTWVIFDAGGDLSDLDGAALASMAHEMALRDALTIVFDHESEVGSGEEFAVTREGDELVATNDLDDDVQTGVDFTLHLAPERLSAGSTYEEMRPLGSRQRLDVRIAAAAFDDADPVVAGEVTLTFAAVAGRDPKNAREGTITGSFRAPLVGEAIAEKNTALLAGALNDRGDGVLALPLASRSAP